MGTILGLLIAIIIIFFTVLWHSKKQNIWFQTEGLDESINFKNTIVWIAIVIGFIILLLINPWTSKIIPTWEHERISFLVIQIVFWSNWIYIHKTYKKLKTLEDSRTGNALESKKKLIIKKRLWRLLWMNLTIWVLLFLILLIGENSLKAVFLFREGTSIGRDTINKGLNQAVDSLLTQ